MILFYIKHVDRQDSYNYRLDPVFSRHLEINCSSLKKNLNHRKKKVRQGTVLCNDNEINSLGNSRNSHTASFKRTKRSVDSFLSG